jgi:hypothetical protein
MTANLTAPMTAGLVDAAPVSAEYFTLPVYFTKAAHNAVVAASSLGTDTTRSCDTLLREALEAAVAAVLDGHTVVTLHPAPRRVAAVGINTPAALALTYVRRLDGGSQLVLSLPSEEW